MLRKLLTVSFLSLACASAHAGIYLEPYLGYLSGTSTQQGSEDGKMKGVAFGARAGYSILGLAFGAEYATGQLKDDSTPENDLTPADAGVFVGYTFPILFRAYATYFPKSKWKSDDGTNSYDLEGKAMKLGVGFTGLPLVVINLEYLTNEFNKFDGQDLTNKIEGKAYMLSVSLPLDF
jgi:Outer membrane protein beta-barrel domain